MASLYHIGAEQSLLQEESLARRREAHLREEARVVLYVYSLGGGVAGRLGRVYSWRYSEGPTEICCLCRVYPCRWHASLPQAGQSSVGGSDGSIASPAGCGIITPIAGKGVVMAPASGIADVDIKLPGEPLARLDEGHFKPLHHQCDGVGREAAGVAVAGVAAHVEGQARMVVVVVDTEGPFLPDAHAQAVCHLHDGQAAQLLYLVFFHFN